jgi:hypothetical protein
MKPWMHQSEIDMIVSYLRPEHKMFEWGCGGSTIFYSNFVLFYRSVEHDVGWYNNIKTLSVNNPKIDLIYRDDKDQYSNYIKSIQDFSDKYDRILIDGRERVKCSIVAKQYLNDDGLIFVHDFFKRRKYNPILEFYDLVDGIKDTEQTLAVFKPK